MRGLSSLVRVFYQILQCPNKAVWYSVFTDKLPKSTGLMYKCDRVCKTVKKQPHLVSLAGAESLWWSLVSMQQNRKCDHPGEVYVSWIMFLICIWFREKSLPHYKPQCWCWQTSGGLDDWKLTQLLLESTSDSIIGTQLLAEALISNAAATAWNYSATGTYPRKCASF